MNARRTPRVSVIVPVRNRRDLLAELLDSLRTQTFTDFELIVVDDGSTDGSGDEARRWAATVPVPVVLLDGEGNGAVRARLRGVAAARADVLAFTDSDCRVAPDWVEQGLRHIDAGADVVQGWTGPAAPVRPLERTVWCTADDGLYPTCNIFYRRSAYEAAGGFDVDAGRRLGFRPGRTLSDLGMGEDTLLGWRVRRSGSSVFAPDVIVHHHVFPPDVRTFLTRSWNAGGFASLVREVPELREVFLRRGVFLGGPRRVPLYAAAAVAVAGRRSAASVLAGVWVGWHLAELRHAPGSRTWRAAAFPWLAIGDLITAVSLVAGSVRSRRVVL